MRGPILAIVALLALPACRSNTGQPSKVPLVSITFLDVGQGDAILIRSRSGINVLVDGGGDPGKSEDLGGDPGHRVVLPALRYAGIQSLDWVIATHPDEDHCQGLVPVLRHFPVKALLAGEGFASGGAGARLAKWARRRRVPRFVPRFGNRIDLGEGARIDIMNPLPGPVIGSRSPRNDQGIVLRLVAGRAR
ncbi:MAG: ComEC/Rec2 family competence protein, partial [Armatimonadota bacterium]